MQSTTPDRAFDALEVAHLEHGLRLAGALLDRDASLRHAGPCLACRDRAHRTFALAIDASWSIYHEAVAAFLPEPQQAELRKATSINTEALRRYEAGHAPAQDHLQLVSHAFGLSGEAA